MILSLWGFCKIKWSNVYNLPSTNVSSYSPIRHGISFSVQICLSKYIVVWRPTTAVQGQYRDLRLEGTRDFVPPGLAFKFLLQFLSKENECASFLLSTHQFNEGYLNYIHETQGFVWLDYPIFWRPFGVSGTETTCNSVPISPSCWAPRETSWDRGSEVIGALNLIMQLGTQSNIKTGLLIVHIILICTTSLWVPSSLRYYAKLNYITPCFT